MLKPKRTDKTIIYSDDHTPENNRVTVAELAEMAKEFANEYDAPFKDIEVSIECGEAYANTYYFFYSRPFTEEEYQQALREYEDSLKSDTERKIENTREGIKWHEKKVSVLKATLAELQSSRANEDS